MMKSHRLPGVLPILVCIVFLGLAAGCGHEKDNLILNQPPTVQITGGPLTGSLAAYTARVYWSGWDFDGIIQHFEYAVDPPSEGFTDSMIAYPERFADISIRILPGPSDRQDTLVVSRSVDGNTYSFRWIETIEFSRSFAFMTPVADTISIGSSGRGPADTFSGLHAVYLRAMDDDGAYSKFDRIGYRAFTITPKATISRPVISDQPLALGTSVTVAWDGIDPDSSDPRKKPVGYVYKLLRLDTLVPALPILSANPTHLYTKGDPTWTYQRGDTLSKTLFLAVPGSYLFGVRAVDEAGAVEPFLEFGRNVFRFQALAGSGNPYLTLTEPSLGTFLFRGAGTAFTVEVPVGAKLRFTWTGNADDYGGTIEGYSWGLDIPDLEREGPNSGWSGWGQIKSNIQPIVFTKPGIHVLYVRARDLSGKIAMATLIMKVLDFSLDREVLLVDDSRETTYPEDDQSDAFWLSLFQDSGRFDMDTDFFTFDIHGPGDVFSPAPIPPTLEQLGRYKLVVWECYGSGYDGATGLIAVTSLRRFLGAYLSAGGKVWIGGAMTVPPMMPAGGNGKADLTYPKNVNDEPNSFAFQFMKLASDRIMNGRGTVPNDNMIGVKPFPGEPVIYPQMDMDPLKISPYKGSISHQEAVFEAIYTYDAGYTGVIDSLFAYQAKKSSSTYNNKLNAVRWHDPDLARPHGRTQWFGFQLYFMKKDQAQETFNRAIDWFREEQPPTANP